MLVKIDKLFLLVDFIILDMEEDKDILIILGRPFLATGRTVIDVQKGELTMKVHDQEDTLNVFKATKFSSDENEEECFRIDVVDSIIQDTDTIPTDKLEACITNMTNNELDAEILEYINYLDKPFHFKSTTPVESLDLPKKDRIKPSIEEPPQLELKLLPNHLKYAFLGNSSELPVIISASLTLEQEEKLLRVLREHKKAIGWTIADIRGISPSF